MYLQKRFYTRETLKSLMIPRLEKIPTLYLDWLRFLKKEMGRFLSCTEGMGVGKDNHCNAQDAALFVDLL